MILFKNAKIFYNGDFFDGDILVEKGVIKQIGNIENSDCPCIDINNNYILPGFVDIHSHGAMNVDFMSDCPEAIETLIKYYASNGTTSVLATTYTEDYQKIKDSIKRISSYIGKSNIVGINIEGPYISPQKKGAQNESYIRKPDIAEFDELIEISNNNIKMITIAPEINNAIESIEYLKSRDVVCSLGHSCADYDTACKAISAGASVITHFFNGLEPLNHRNPSIVGAGLINEDITLEIICDGYHIHKDLIKYLFKTKKNQLALVTDSVSPAGCADGDYLFAGLPIQKCGEKITLKQGGNLAGSALKMSNALKNALEFTQMEPKDIIPSLTIIPAKAINIDSKKGSLEIGKDADFVITDKNFNILSTYLQGKKIYSK
ncbi:MAG: N-acetylglucosamine-6-phosphate deacetylase [Ruminococcaceae bacterium]|nr:N-acetylglucosamine-6-phosphate deacetylase [Oscillospiraceae bacterium]